MTKDAQKIIIWETIGLVIVAVIFCFVDVVPSLEDISALTEDIGSIKMTLEGCPQGEKEKGKKELIATMQEREKSMSIIEEAISDIEGKVLSEKNAAFLNQEIIVLADYCKIELNMIKPLSGKSVGAYELLPMSLMFQCEYPELIAFLSKVNTSYVFAGVDTISVRSSERNYPLLNVELQIFALFQQRESQK